MKRLVLGVFLVLTAILSKVVFVHSIDLILVYTAFLGIGLIFIFDSIVYFLRGKSLLTGPFSTIFHAVITGFLAAILIEILFNSILKLWHYNVSLAIYLAIFPFFLSIGFLNLYESYLAISSIIHHAIPRKRRKYTNHPGNDMLFTLLGSLSLFTLILCLFTSFDTNIPQQSLAFLNTYLSINPNFILIILFPLSVFFLIEYLEYVHHEDSCLLHLFEGDIIPFIAVIIASCISSLIIESFNLSMNLWQYSNWPFQQYTILGIPAIILIFWPIQYLVYIALYHFLFKHETKTIWL